MRAVASARTSVAIVLALAATLFPLNAAAEGDFTHRFSDEMSGVGCQYYSVGGRQSWKRKLGDWVDRNGRMHGDEAYAVARTGQAPLSEGMYLDITELARQWLNGSRPNTGILLRALSGSATLELPSREADPSLAPVLELEWNDGSLESLDVAVDATLDCSTDKGNGKSKRLRIAPELNVLLVFELPKGAATDLRKARLRLLPQRLYGRSLAIGAFSTQPPWAYATKARTDGIAARYAEDVGIGADAAVLFATSFEDKDWMHDWNRLTRGNVAQVGPGEGNGFVPLAGSAIRATLSKGENTALNLRYLFRQHHGEEPEEIYFRYYLRLGADWNPDVEGGKMPGFAGTYGRAGWGNRITDGTNGWSARGSFGRAFPLRPGEKPVTALGSFVYHAEVKSPFGAHWPWSLGRGGLVHNERWYSVEQHVKLNTPGKHNGVLRAWIDGVLVAERTEISFRTVADLRVESLWMNVYHGGIAKSPRDMSLYIDNLVIARSYIGPMSRREAGGSR